MSGFGTGSNSNGQFWFGGSSFPGFLYKKNAGVGGRRSTKFNPGGNITCNSPTYLYNKYKPGAGGIGASSTSNRRAKNRLATICSSQQCFPCFNTLGQYSNYTHNPNGFIPCPANAVNNSVTPTPIPIVTFNVTYLGNGSTSGSPPIDANSYNSGSLVTILGNTGSPVLTRAGFTFAGWKINNTGTTYVQGNTFTINANTILYAQWTPNPSNTFNVTYLGNGNTGGTPPTDSNLYNPSSSVTILGNTGSPVLVKSGFTFAGWKINNTGTTYVQGNTFSINANTILYAQWTPNPSNTFNVTYLGNGNTGGTAPVDGLSPYTSGSLVTILGNNTLTKTGFGFAGWNTAANGSGMPYIDDDTFIITQHTTLHAQWISGAVSLFYDFGLNGGAGSPPPSSGLSYPTFSTQNVANNTFTNTNGYTFGGWNTRANGSGTSYPVGSPITMVSSLSTITLYAQWINPAIQRTLTYNPGSAPATGTAPALPTTYFSNSTATILDNTGPFTNGSLIFYGWNTSSGGTGTSYPVGSTITMNVNKTLFAQWGSAPLVIVKYDANGASGAVPADQPYPSGVQVTILGQGSLTNTGNTFLGWNENSSGVGSLYAPGYKFASKNVTLYAQWAPGSTIKSCGPTETYTTGPNTWYDIPYAQVIASTSANTITIFLAAYFGTTQSNVGTGVGPYNIISFTSKTTITPISIINNTYTTYSIPANNYNYSQTILNSSANYWPTSPSLVPISTITFPSINVNSTGSNIHSNPATFNRATALISNGCGIGAYESFFSGPTNSIDTQFYFFNQGLQLNFLNGASTTSTQIVNCPITALYTTNKNSTSAWTTMPISYYPYVGITPATHNTLTAITIIPSLGSKSISPPIPDVSLQYNANGLSGENGTKNNVTGLPSTGGLPAPTYFAPYNIAGPTSVAVGGNVGANNYYLTKKDASGNEFIFTKWNTAADGSGTDYGPGFNTTYLSSSGTNILYAQWIPGYYVNYNGNGNTAGSQGVGDVLSPYPITGASVIVRANTSPVGFPGPFTKTGYSFSSWNTAASGTGTSYVGGNTFTITQNTDLYAQWILNPFSTTGGATTSYTSGTFVITFTTNGTMTFNSGIAMPATINYLLIGGGGGGGKNLTARGGGGGAGGQVITATNVLVTATPTTTLTFTIAQASGFIPTSDPANGGNTQLSGAGITTIIASGGLVGGNSTSTLNGSGGAGTLGGGNGGTGGNLSTAGANGGIGTGVNINGTMYYFGGGGAGGNGSSASTSPQGGQGGGGGSGTGTSASNPIGNANINPYLGPNNISQGTTSAGYTNSGGGGAGANGGSSFGWKVGGSGLAVVWFSYP